MPSLMLQSFSFVHPGIAGIALGLGVIPIAIHLINRQRYHRVPWAAMSFLLAARKRSARRVWFEQWLLAMVRIAVIVLLGLAVARPYLRALPFLPLRSSGVHHIIVLDNSLSMNARTREGQTRFALARQYAQQLIASFPRTDAVSVVTLSEPATPVIAHAAYDHRFVQDRVAAIEPTQRAADAAGALANAREILGQSEMPVGNRAVYVISDFPQNVWLGGTAQRRNTGQPGPTAPVAAVRHLADVLIDPAVDLTLIAVASDPGRTGETIENVAVSDLALDSTLVAVDVPVRVVTEVTNFGMTSVRNLSLQIRRDDEIIRREPLPTIEPGKSTVATVSMGFATCGTHIVEAKVLPAAADALPDDDMRHLSIDVRSTIPVLLVDGRQLATLLAGQAGYLATALAPKQAVSQDRWPQRTRTPVSDDGLIETKVVGPVELEGEVLGDYDVVVMCNVQRLPGTSWRYLEQFVSRGGGLLVFGGDLVDAQDYNSFGYADGAGLLPFKITRVAEAHQPTVHGDGRVSFKPDNLTHAIVAEFADQPDSGLFTASVDRYLPVELDPARAEVVLRYNNDDPALIASKFERGRVVVCTTTANMEWNNLPAKGDYVSLMLNTIAHLSPHHGEHRNVIVGQTATEPLTAVLSSLPLHVATEQGPTLGRVVPFNEGLALEYGPVESAGVFKMMLGSQARAFAANVDPHESDLVPADAAALNKAIERPVNLVAGVTFEASRFGPGGDHKTGGGGRSSELTSAVLYVVLALLGAEMFLAMWFGSHRR